MAYIPYQERLQNEREAAEETYLARAAGRAALLGDIAINLGQVSQDTEGHPGRFLAYVEVLQNPQELNWDTVSHPMHGLRIVNDAVEGFYLPGALVDVADPLSKNDKLAPAHHLIGALILPDKRIWVANEPVANRTYQVPEEDAGQLEALNDGSLHRILFQLRYMQLPRQKW